MEPWTRLSIREERRTSNLGRRKGWEMIWKVSWRGLEKEWSLEPDYFSEKREEEPALVEKMAEKCFEIFLEKRYSCALHVLVSITISALNVKAAKKG